jgi:hypothetical protein
MWATEGDAQKLDLVDYITGAIIGQSDIIGQGDDAADIEWERQTADAGEIEQIWQHELEANWTTIEQLAAALLADDTSAVAAFVERSRDEGRQV